MKHFSKKKYLQGAGWLSKPRIPDPKPSILREPNLGGYKILQSYSVAEIIDLISDGPVHGLVDKNGKDVNRGGGSLLQSVYLDNTPVQNTSDTDYDLSAISLGSVDISSTLKQLGDIYYQPNTPTIEAEYKRFTVDYDPQNLGKAFDKLQFIHSVNNERLLFGNAFYALMFFPREGRYYFTFDYATTAADCLTAKKFPLSTWDIVSISSTFRGITDYIPVLFTKQFGTKKIEINMSESSLASEGLLKEYNQELDIKLNSASTNQKYFINLIKSKIQTLNALQRKKHTFMYNLYEKATVAEDFRGNFQAQKDFFQYEKDLYIIINLGDFSIPALNGISIFKKDSEGNLTTEINEFNFILESFQGFEDKVTPLIVPKINANNQYTGEFYGYLVFETNVTKIINIARDTDADKFPLVEGTLYEQSYIIGDLISYFASASAKLNFVNVLDLSSIAKTTKYNFSNIACEFKNGEEIQDPLSDFKYIYVDYDYNSSLIGPFNKNTSSYIERVLKVDNYSAEKPNLTGSVESSVDVRTVKQGKSTQNYSRWNDLYNFNEEPVPFTHTIENANVEFVSFSLAISSLYDTIEEDEGTNDTNRKIGERRPAIVRFRVEVGTNIDGKVTPTYIKTYAVIALVEGQMIIDFGDPSLKGRADNYISVRDFTDGTNKPSELSEIFPLPDIDKDKNSTNVKRFIKIYKLSAETNSVLIKKDINIYKVTEIIPNQLSYPFCSLMGIKLDGRSFSQAPERTYDCRLKKVKIPSNYYPLDESNGNVDKRYITNKSSYNGNQLIYRGDWDGSFKDGWTDNPAWIIYDLLASKRYGLGAYLDISQINKWELYKIGRFCDAVDDEGYFIGVSDGIGGLEPRYSCNVVFREATKIYDAIVSVTNLFRGTCYFSNSEVHFTDDRPRLPIITFTNNNVKDGIFNYSNVRKDQQYNTIEVAYLDRFDNFQSKIEYIEDEQDIRKRGVFKSKIESFGVTSRAMARRIGQHMIYQTIKENQAVEFTAGLEALLCRPGDLMIVEDDLKTRSKNHGKVLEINTTNKSLLLDNTYLPDEFNGKITVYNPTGHQTSEDIQQLLYLNRSRLPYFDVTSNLITSADNILTGRYYFDKYVAVSDYVQYPFYTGLSSMGHKIFCYYSTVATGFVFSTGLSYQDDNTYDKVITDSSISQITEILSVGDQYKNLNSGYRYSSTSANKRGTSSNISEKIKTPNIVEYGGILESEIDTNSNAQTINYNITGYDILDYGCRVFLDKNNVNINLLDYVSIGSSYRIGRNNAEDQIYKILAIKEENQNEYVIVGSKFNTGKFLEIENFSKEDFLPSTYYSGPSKVGNIDIKELTAPKITSFTTGKLDVDGSFSLTASWESNSDALKYRYDVYNEVFSVRYTGETTSTSTTLTKINALGDWKINLYSVGNGGSKIDSQPSKSGVFVAYYAKEFTTLTKPAIINFTIT
jgi:hypothetical protein